MSGRPIKKGATDVSTVIRIVDSGDGTPETGVTSASAGLDLKYRREGAATADLTESDLSALTDAHSDGGLLHIGAGYYRVDLPDAAVATGANGVLVFGAVTGMVVIGTYHPLVDYDPQDGVRLGLTALPNAAADAAGGLPISDAGGLDLDALNSNVSAILADTGTDGVVVNAAGLATDAVNEIRNAITGGAYALNTSASGSVRVVDGTGTDEIDLASGAVAVQAASVRAAVGLASANLDTQLDALPTAAENADAVWDEARSGHVAAGSFGLAAQVIRDGTAQGGVASPPSITLDAGASSVDGIYAGCVLHIVSGTGAGQSAIATDYGGTTKLLALSIPSSGPTWTTPDNTSVFVLRPHGYKIPQVNELVGSVVASLSSGSISASTFAANAITASTIAANAIGASELATDAVEEIRNAITGGAYALNTDAGGNVKISDGTGANQISLTSGLIDGITGTINTLDALDTAQDAQHTATQNLVSAAAIRAALGLAAANLDTQLDAIPTAEENAAALLDLTNGVESGVTPRQALRGMASALFGLVSSAGTGTEVFKGAGQAAGGTTRLTYTVDSSGNRTAVALNL